MDIKKIKENLNTNYTGRSMELLKETESTNDYAKRLAQNRTVPAGHTIIAERQTAGRGQAGKSFFSPAGGIYMSVILRPDLSVRFSGLITPCAAVAVAEAADGLCGTDTEIKWVNDLLLRRKKYCGILTESSVSANTDYFNFIVIGIGLNVLSTEKFFDAELRRTATSLEDVTGAHISRSILTAKILDNIEKHFYEIESGGFMTEYKKRLINTN